MFPRFNWLIEPNLSNFRVFFCEYAHKIALTSSFSQPTMHSRYRLAAGLRPDPLGDPLAGLNGPISKGRGEDGKTGWKGKGRGGEERKGKGRRGRGL